MENILPQKSGRTENIMKSTIKKITAVFTLAVLALCACVVLTACGGGGEDGGETGKVSKGIKYAVYLGGNTACVKSIGTCQDTDIVIADTYDGMPVTHIDTNAFANNTRITSVVIPNSVTEICSSAFSSCTSLQSVTIPSSVKKIGTYAFDGCTSLESITIPNGVTEICANAFNGTGLKSITIPSSVTKLEAAFKNCTSLKSAVLSDGRKYDTVNLFAGCTSLEEITLPHVNYLGLLFGTNSCDGCNATEQANRTDGSKEIYYIPSSLKKVTVTGNSENGASDDVVYANTFQNCTSLTSVTLGSGVKEIRDNAFLDCTSLTSVTLPDTISKVSSLAFEGCNSLTYNEYENCCYLGNSSNGYLCLVKPKSDSITSLTMHEGCKLVCGYAFQGCNSLSGDLTLSVNVGDFAFAGNPLKNVTLSDSVTYIGDTAFAGCKLESVTIGENVTSIGKYAFSANGDLKKITYNATNCSDVGMNVFLAGGRSGDGIRLIIGANVTDISKDLFNAEYSDMYPNITEIVFAPGCQIKSAAPFDRLEKTLTTVYYDKSTSLWSDLTAGVITNYLTRAGKCYYSETEPTETGSYWHYDANGDVVRW